VICDTGHNEHGMQQICKQLNAFTSGQIHFVLGMVNDKKHDAVLKLLPQNAIYYFTKAQLPRALDESVLQEMANQYGLNGNCYEDVNTAYHAAFHSANKNDLIFIGGSTFLVADFLLGLKNNQTL
jgi:dihydrofolate synthase/folylpolyglutamate synthase